MEEVAHSGLRALKTPPPPPGVRPGLPLEPGPERSDRTLRRSAGDGLPHLALPSLASSAREAVDSATLAFVQVKRGGGEEGPQRLEAAAQAGQGQVFWPCWTTPVALLSRRRGCGSLLSSHRIGAGCLGAWVLLDFFFGQKEEEAKADDETGSLCSVSRCRIRSAGCSDVSGRCRVLRFASFDRGCCSCVSSGFWVHFPLLCVKVDSGSCGQCAVSRGCLRSTSYWIFLGAFVSILRFHS